MLIFLHFSERSNIIIRVARLISISKGAAEKVLSLYKVGKRKIKKVDGIALLAESRFPSENFFIMEFVIYVNYVKLGQASFTE